MTVEYILLEFGGYEADFGMHTVKKMAEEILRLRNPIKAKDLDALTEK